MTSPPQLPSESRASSKRAVKLIISIVCAVVILGAGCIFLIIHYVTVSGLTRSTDNQFGDQHLKTTVALLELHKVRYGRYPQSLRELRFTGEWDQLWLSGVLYVASPDGSKYYVEVERGWIGRPVLNYPPEFWQGTGYSSALKPKPH
jgi:hypothetical protein